MSTVTAKGVLAATIADLAASTPPEEIKQRVAYGKGGPVYNPDGTPKMLDYVDARFVQERLDETVGAHNWQTAFQDTPGGVRCGIGINVEGEWVWKFDVGIPSNIEPVKGAHSDAFKRAAVQWGIGRDLYSNREDRVDDEPDDDDQPTVRQQAQGNARQQRYGGQQAQARPQPANVPVPDEEPPQCPLGHGDMVWKSGNRKNGSGTWQGWFCSDRDCPTQPIWRK